MTDLQACSYTKLAQKLNQIVLIYWHSAMHKWTDLCEFNKYANLFCKLDILISLLLIPYKSLLRLLTTCIFFLVFNSEQGIHQILN